VLNIFHKIVSWVTDYNIFLLYHNFRHNNLWLCAAIDGMAFHTG